MAAARLITMHPLRAALSALLVAAGLVLLAPAAPAAACSCAVGDTADHLRGASTVFAGELAQRDRGRRWVEYTFAVDEVYKGTATRTVRVLTGTSGSACGLPGLTVGERYVVFGFVPPKEDRLFVGLCGGTLSGPGAIERVEALTGPGSVPEPGGPPIEDDKSVRPFIPYWSMAAIGAGLLGLIALGVRRARSRTPARTRAS